MLATTTTSLYREVTGSKAPYSAVQPLNGSSETLISNIPYINLSYDSNNSEASIRKLAYKIRPRWRETPEELEFTKFTDGITNTLLRITRRRPGATQEEVDDEAVLMRAYGNNTDLIIDRDREANSHALLAARDMAPPLLARFNNGLLYKYIAGKACSPDDLTQERVWKGVAKKLAEWHARVPVSAVSAKMKPHSNGANGQSLRNSINSNIQKLGTGQHSSHNGHGTMERRLPSPNLWSVLQSWIDILPVTTDKERARRDLLQHELKRTFEELDTQSGIGENGFVFGHLDLLSGNVIMLPLKPDAPILPSESLPVTFIDYEYATPCPAAMDIANHFAEWAGFDLDYTRLPSQCVRKSFLTEYVHAYNQFSDTKVGESTIDSLMEQVDCWRGIPGLFWGIWALIQATISQIDFDYAQYAEQRLDEYWAWRAEASGVRALSGKAMPLREQIWSRET